MRAFYLAGESARCEATECEPTDIAQIVPSRVRWLVSRATPRAPHLLICLIQKSNCALILKNRADMIDNGSRYVDRGVTPGAVGAE